MVIFLLMVPNRNLVYTTSRLLHFNLLKRNIRFYLNSKYPPIPLHCLPGRRSHHVPRSPKSFNQAFDTQYKVIWHTYALFDAHPHLSVVCLVDGHITRIVILKILAKRSGYTKRHKYPRNAISSRKSNGTNYYDS